MLDKVLDAIASGILIVVLLAGGLFLAISLIVGLVNPETRGPVSIALIVFVSVLAVVWAVQRVDL